MNITQKHPENNSQETERKKHKLYKMSSESIKKIFKHTQAQVLEIHQLSQKLHPAERSVTYAVLFLIVLIPLP